MKIKEIASAIILNAFLGYLWVVFCQHLIGIANSMDNVFFVGGIILVIGSLLFFEIVNRITPFNEYKFTHPIKMTGFLSFGLVAVFMTLTAN